MPKQCRMGRENGFQPDTKDPVVIALNNKIFADIEDIENGSLTQPTPTVDDEGNITLTHWSEEGNLTNVDPSYYGKGLQGSNANTNRGKNFVPFSSYGIDVGRPRGYSKESGLGKNRYTTKIKAGRLYAVSSDPKNFHVKADEMAKQAGEVKDYNGLFMAQVLKEAGYAGVWALKGGTNLQASIWETLEVSPEKVRDATQADFENLMDSLSVTQNQVELWRRNRKKNEFLQHPVLKKLAKRRLENKDVSDQMWAEAVLKFDPITPIGAVQEIPSFGEMLGAIKGKALKGLIKPVEQFKSKEPGYAMVPEGKVVSPRLDIPAYTRTNTWVVTVHEPDTPSRPGPVIGYAKSATVVSDRSGPVKFSDNPEHSLRISTGEAKFPFAVFTGAWKNESIDSTKKRAQDALNSGDWVEVGMNPNRFGYFYIKKTGQKILTSPEVIQIGPLLLARITIDGQPVATIEDTAYSQLLTDSLK